MSFVPKIFRALTEKHQLPEPVILNYRMNYIRWHLDTRPPHCVLLLHDFFASSEMWVPLISSLSGITKRGLTPTVPLAVYAVDFRNHGDSPHTSTNTLLNYVADVVHFSETVVTKVPNLQIVAHGFGAQVALLAALLQPDMFSQVMFVTDSGSSVFDQKPPAQLLEPLGLVSEPLKTAKEAAKKSGIGGIDPEIAKCFLMNMREVYCEETRTTELRWKCNAEVLQKSANHLYKYPTELPFSRLAPFNKPAMLFHNSKHSEAQDLTKLFPKLHLRKAKGDQYRRILGQPEAEELTDAVLDFAGLLGDMKDGNPVKDAPSFGN